MTGFFREFYQGWQNDLLRVEGNDELTELEIRILRNRDSIQKYLTRISSRKQQYLDKLIQDTQSQIHYNERMRDQQLQQRILEVRELIEQYTRELTELQQQSELIQQQIEDKRQQIHKSLSPARIQQFHQFEADESLAGDRCGVCLDDIEVGRKMMRLDCNGQHVFCQDCVEGWFADHNTCPNCRHTFT